MIEVRFQTKITLNLCYILAPLLLAASRACSMSLCQTFFSNCYFSYSFWPIFLTKLGTHDLCANMHKTVELIFKILILKILANFW